MFRQLIEGAQLLEAAGDALGEGLGQGVMVEGQVSPGIRCTLRHTEGSQSL